MYHTQCMSCMNIPRTVPGTAYVVLLLCMNVRHTTTVQYVAKPGTAYVIMRSLDVRTSSHRTLKNMAVWLNGLKL